MREWLLEVVYRNLPPREAGLLAGMVWGDRSGFSAELTNNLKDSGLWHLVVVSGANVMILARMLVEVLAPIIGRKKAIGVMMITVWGYAGIVGWEMPVVRAIILMSIYYWAQVLGRKFDVWRSLMLTAILVLVADPEAVGSLSWWLSIMAFLGVVTGGNLNSFWQTIWVGVWVTPLLAVTLGKISWISPLANVAVLFMVEIVTVIGLVGTLTGGWLLWAAMPFLKWLLIVAELSGKVGVINFNFNWFLAAGWYTLVFWFLRRNSKPLSPSDSSPRGRGAT